MVEKLNRQESGLAVAASLTTLRALYTGLPSLWSQAHSW